MSNLRWPVVLFDLDGTLANSIDLVVASYRAAFATIGRTVERDVALHWIGETLRQTYAREAPDHGPDMEVVYRAYYADHVDQIAGYPGMPELLVSLADAGAVIGVVTAKRREVALVTMRQAGVEGLIELLGAMEDTTAHKPDPEPLLAAAAKLGVRPEDCVYVGDAIHDVVAAKAAGMAIIAVTWGAGLAEELQALAPDAMANDVTQLTDLLMN
ncbi:MAG: HAD-IA family hydrolase [Propionibacteriaceae bacterium]|nr:HAD-IA family hydrolase [Propionibacteriaceae bacterium]